MLLSVPRSLRNEIETPLLESLRSASRVFSQQAAPPNSGSALQSVFLTNVVVLAGKTSRRSSAHHTVDRLADPSQQPAILEAERRGPVHVEVTRGTSSDTVTLQAQVQTLRESNRQYESVEQEFGTSTTPESQELNFFDEEMWSTMFANAGFDINSQQFLLPEVSG